MVCITLLLLHTPHTILSHTHTLSMPSAPLQITAALMSRNSKEHYVTAAALTASHAGPWQVPVATVSSGCAARAQNKREGGREEYMHPHCRTEHQSQAAGQIAHRIRIIAWPLSVNYPTLQSSHYTPSTLSSY